MEKKNSILSFVENAAKIISIILGLSFVFGFLIWNTYLYGLGFKEDGIIQTRFIYTGICFILITLILFILFYQVWRLLKFLIEKIRYNQLKKILKNILFFLLVIFCTLYFFFFVYSIFTRLPIVLGGGRPRGLSIITDSNDLSYLTNFGVLPANGSSVQTVNLCVAYENDKYVVVILDDRILQIKNDKFKGFVSLPGISVRVSRNCSEFSRLWLKKTFLFEFASNKLVEEQIKCEQKILNNR